MITILRKSLFYICVLSSAITAILGFEEYHVRPCEAAVLLCAVLWIIARKKIPSVCLFLSLVIATAGLLLKVSPLVMFFYSGFSLAAWDIASLEISLKNNSKERMSNHYQFTRVLSLLSALAIGFPLIFAGRTLHLKIPFFVMVLLAIVTFFSINRIVNIVKRKE
jgi:hypothetical protein